MGKKGFFDKFTHIDELVEEAINLLKQIDSGEIVAQVPDSLTDTIEEIRDLVKYQHDKNYEIHFFTYPNTGDVVTLGVGDTVLDFKAGTIKDSNGDVTKMSTSLGHLKKDFLRSIAVNADKKIIVQLDTKDKIMVKADNWFVGTYQQFTRVIITCSVATELFLLCCTNPEAIIEMVGESTISIGREERNQLKSDKDTHFTGAIVQNAVETENIIGLDSNEITITGVSIQADENLIYRLWLFETDGHADTDLDIDDFVEFVDLDLAADGARIGGTGQYYYAITNLGIDYEDLDGTKELHLALQNLSAASKTAGAAGEVKIKCSYIPRT